MTTGSNEQLEKEVDTTEPFCKYHIVDMYGDAKAKAIMSATTSRPCRFTQSTNEDVVEYCDPTDKAELERVLDDAADEEYKKIQSVRDSMREEMDLAQGKLVQGKDVHN